MVGPDRQTLAKDLVRRYTQGESIRNLAASTGRSYGFVHRALSESGVQLRQRGGARRRSKDVVTKGRPPKRTPARKKRSSSSSCIRLAHKVQVHMW